MGQIPLNAIAFGTYYQAPIQVALTAGLVPVVHGDVVIDTVRGGTILSTEDLFNHLTRIFQPKRILLAGIEPGVWADFPACTRIIGEISPSSLKAMENGIVGSAAPDVTGGMASKVRESLALIEALPGLQIMIFSGEEPGRVMDVLLDAYLGTLLINRGR